MKKFIGLLLVLCLFNFLLGLGGGGADTAEFPDIYIDEGVGGTHVGSIANPYDDFADINWTTGGDNSIFDWYAGAEDASVTINLMEGDEWREQLTVGTSGSATYPIIIRSYGAGADPIINGADVITTWTEAVGSWATAWSETLTGDTDEANDMTIRIEVPNAQISTSGTEIRVTLEASSGSASNVGGCSIGQKAGAGDDWDMASTTRITFDGESASVVIAAGAEELSDEIEFTLDSSEDHILHVWLTPDRNYRKLSSGGSNDMHYDVEPPEDQTMIANIGGLTTIGGGCAMFNKLEVRSTPTNVWQATVTTEPSQVFFDGVRGSLQASAAACTGAGHWFWAANVLYVYYTEDPDGAVTIESSARNYTVQIGDKTYITLEGLELKYSDSSSLRVQDSSSNFVIDNCNVHGAGYYGVFVWGTVAQITNGSIKNCNVHDNWRVGIFVGCDEDGPTGITIENNNIQDNGAYPSHGLYFDQASSNIVRYNAIYGSGANGAQFQFGSDSNEFYYNLVYENDAVGILCGAGDGGNSNEIYNNIVFNNGQSGFHLADGVALGNLIKNNIIYQDTGVVGSDASCIRLMNSDDIAGNTFDYNCYLYAGKGGDIIEVGTGATTWYTLVEWQALGSSPDPNSINIDPQFIDLSNDDFRLLMASPCINAGTDVGLTEDYQGLKIRHAPDIGAYENQTNAVFLSAELLSFSDLWLLWNDKLKGQSWWEELGVYLKETK